MAVAVTTKWFTRAMANLVGGDSGAEAFSLDWISDTVRVALVNAVPNQDTPEFWADLSGTAVSGTNWAAAGVTLAGKTVSVNTSTNVVTLDASDVVVSDVTVSNVAAIVVYKDSGTPSTSPLLGFGSLASTGASTGGTLTLTWAATGILTLTAAA